MRVAQRGVGGVLVGCSPSEGKVFSKNIKGGPKEKLWEIYPSLKKIVGKKSQRRDRSKNFDNFELAPGREVVWACL